MKNNKRNGLTEKNMTKIEALKRFTASLQLKNKSRQLLSLFFIYALVFVPLMTIESAMPKAFGQLPDPCDPTANRIFQNCSLGGGSVEAALTNQAIDDVINFYDLPATDRTRVMGHARNEVRSMLYLRLIELIKKPNRTPEEQSALDAFTARIKARRVLAAQKARDEYLRWQSGPCYRSQQNPGYQPPAPYSYNAGPACGTGYSVYFTGGPNVPSFEEFQQFGAAIAYQDLFTPAAQDVSKETTTGVIVGVGAAAAIVGTAIAAGIGSTLSFATLSAIVPYAGVTIVTLVGSGGIGSLPVAVAPAAGASGSVGASLAAGPAAIILIAVTFAVVQGINVAAISALPGKLQQAIIDAQNQTINLSDLLTTDVGNQEIYGAFLLATMPDFPATDIPAPVSTDREFQLRQQTGNTTTYNSSIGYVDWDGVCHSARLSGAWFIDTKNGVEKQRLSIQFRDWNGQRRIASRNGGQFIITNPANLNETQLTDEILYRDCGSVNRGAKIKFEVLYLLTRRAIRVNCSSITINPDPGTDYDLGAVYAPAALPANLTATVNNAASSTVNNVTVRNLSIDQNYRITANIAYQAATAPATATFTLKVRDSFGQESSENLTVKKSAIVDNLAPPLPNGAVGAAYSAQLTDGNVLTTCSPATISITGGALPTGTNLEFSNFGVPRISGTPLSGGLYRFEVTKSYANGENLRRNYSIFISSELAVLPEGATSWWRAETNAEDFYGLHHGIKVGSVKHDGGKVNQAFKFDGTNGYISLPDDTFSPSLDFTFETWFKTETAGVILGQQRAVAPYNAPQFGATPAIYVDQNGKLRVQMFASQSGQFVTSETRVDDNGFHHVAVSYDRTSQTRTVYLDGENIGSQNLGQFASSNYKYQFGTGYVNDGFVGGLTGWINFNGLIDEPTLYNRVLSSAQIAEIFKSGDAGKMSVSVFTTPAQTRNTSTGSITITARGGTPALNYSIDGGATFQNTNSFIGLAPGTYTVVVKDGANRTITRTATVVNPPPTLNLTTSTISPTCNGAQNGEIVIFPTGGTGDLEYSILNGANVQSSNIFSGINGATYTPWVRDINSGTVYAGAPVTLSQPSAFTVSPSNFVNAALNVPYSRTFTISGGTPPFVVTAGGANFNNGYQLPTGLTATADGNSITISGTPQEVGTFPILFAIRDQNTCYEGRNFPLIITAAASYGISGRVTNGGQGLANVTVSYSGASNGSTTTDASGNYSLNSLAGGGGYTITATLTNATFAQPSILFNNLSANFTDVNFATAPTTYEGDIAGRPIGDGAINVLDLVTLGRIINNLDAQPAIGAEWQRADIAPRSTLGNGVIDTNDLTQMRNYIVGNNIRLRSGGAIAPANFSESTTKESLVNSIIETKNQDISSFGSSATISAGTVGLSNNIFVPITLTSTGNVSAVQFTINYDTTKLFLSTIQSSAGLPPNTTIITNDDIPGRINVLVYLPQDGSAVFPNGNVQLMRLRFSATPNATGIGVVSFSDTPVERIAADPQAAAVSLAGTSGGVVFTPTAASVTLSGQVKDGSRGLPNSIVRLTDQNGEIRTVRTGSFGYYSFTEVDAGETYVISAVSKGYSFNSQVVNVTENISNLDFIAQ